MSKEIAKIGSQIEKLQTMSTADVFKHIRWSQEERKGSLYDVIQILTGCTSQNTALYWSRVVSAHPEVLTKCKNLKFPGKGQKETPVADTGTLVEIAYLCPGKAAAQFRRQGAELLCRHLAGDLSLIDEIVSRHQHIDGPTQEKILSGTSSTVEQANAVPKAFQFIETSHVLFKQPMFYMGRYRELDGPDCVKIGQSKDVLKRIKNGDQEERLYWNHLIPMPNQRSLDALEDAVKKWAREHGLLAKKKEYIDPVKLSQKLGIEDVWTPDQATQGLMALVNPMLAEGQQIINVSRAEDTDVVLAEPVLPMERYEIVSKDHDFAGSLTELPFFGELAESLKKCLAVTTREHERPVKSEVAVKQVELEMERERTKQIELETKSKMVIEMIKLGKTESEIRALVDIVMGIQNVDPTKRQSYEADNDKYAQFLLETCSKSNGVLIGTMELGQHFFDWCNTRYGINSVNKAVKTHAGKLWEALEKEPWIGVLKEKIKERGNTYHFINLQYSGIPSL